jgi:hypothetical protein
MARLAQFDRNLPHARRIAVALPSRCVPSMALESAGDHVSGADDLQETAV